MRREPGWVLSKYRLRNTLNHAAVGAHKKRPRSAHFQGNLQPVPTVLNPIRSSVYDLRAPASGPLRLAVFQID